MIAAPPETPTFAVTAQTETAIALTALIDRASKALAGARSAAEVLEARDMASVAYDAARKAVRLGKAKRAHDEVIAAAYRAQADALEIEAQAKRRLADEYDAAQGLPPAHEVAGYFAGTDAAIIISERLRPDAAWLADFSDAWKDEQ
jgi:hypothetical protein